MIPNHKPGSSHPWRQYADRWVPLKVEVKPEPRIKSPHLLLQELVESWETIEVITTWKGEGRYFLKDLPYRKQAAWLSGILKRNYK